MSNYIFEKSVQHKRVGFMVNLLLKSRGVIDTCLFSVIVLVGKSSQLHLFETIKSRISVSYHECANPSRYSGVIDFALIFS